MKIKTSELTGAALDWAVAKCEGYQAVYTNGSLRPVYRKGKSVEDTWPDYTTDWAHGGPILEREGIYLIPNENADGWLAHKVGGDQGDYSGPTPLVAAMRAYAAEKLGHEVDVPGELT